MGMPLIILAASLGSANHSRTVEETLRSPSCLQLASALSSAYQSTQPFTGTSKADLHSYLRSNGVLFTMCMDASNCSAAWPPPPPPSAGPHWSGSWINNRTGVHLIRDQAVGVVADPAALDLQCLYPTDGGTDARDENGCGPLISDPLYGSHGASNLTAAERAAFKQYVDDQIAKSFPGKTWQQIPCAALTSMAGTALANGTSWLPDSNAAGACEEMKQGKRGLNFTTLPAVVASMWEAIVGERLCTAAPPQIDTYGHWFEYDGPCSWRPTEWQQMVDAMLRWFSPHDAALGPGGWWNEIVAAWPASAAEFARIAQAVFYIATPQMDARTLAATKAAAERNARMYGGRPLLVIDSAKFLAGGPLFACAE